MAKKDKKNKGIMNAAVPNHDKQTWENTTKEQPYLMPGTAEYEERVEDLHAHDPFRPDDKWHEKLEEHDQGHRDRISVRNPKREEEGRRNYRLQTAKKTQFGSVKSAAIEQAKQTPQLDDDEEAKKMKPKSLDSLVYDNGVVPDEFLPKSLRKYQ